MNKVKEWFNKIKTIKHIHIYLAVFVGIVLCVAYFSFLNKPTDKKEDVSTSADNTAVEYVKNLENKLSNVLSKISGVGQTSVLITLESGFSYEYAKDIETRTSSSGGNDIVISTEKVILDNGEPVVVKEYYPTIKGVVIVAKGAENFSVKMNILTAATTVLEIDSSNITILC